MLRNSKATEALWWGAYTLLAVWAQRFAPGVDFLASGLVFSMQERSNACTIWLAAVWILLLEGMGNLPFGYGLAWYGLLAVFYLVGRWLFEARSILFMCLLGLGLGVLHPLLVYFLASLGNLAVSMRTTLIEGAVQAAIFPVVWVAVDHFFPKGLRQDDKPL